MASEVLKLTAQIVISHASMSELTPDQLVGEIKEVYNLLASLEGDMILPEVPEPLIGKEEVRKPPIPLKDIVKEKYVVCLECGKKMRTLKAHIRRTHNLMPREYFNRYGLDPKKFPLVCKEYSEQRRKLAIEKGLGAQRGKRKTKTA
ncbi:MAG: transcriptional regulator [Deltaproteobacteria bacterium]|nr:MAG: transcriptional regulator [Deltaproteobacteria bacterium]